VASLELTRNELAQNNMELSALLSQLDPLNANVADETPDASASLPAANE